MPMSYLISLTQIVTVMANCIQCGKDVGCACNLINGFCKKCFKAPTPAKNNEKLVELRADCKTIPELNLLLAKLKSKNDRSDLYRIVIINSQIANYTKDPCKYKNIINKI